MAKTRGVLPILEVGYRAFLPIRPLISKAVDWFIRAPAAFQKREFNTNSKSN